MARLFVLLSLACVALSNPLFIATTDERTIDRYNPIRRLMDVLCMSFETSFCKGNTSPATVNHILPEASTRKIPALCEPSNFMDYRNFVDGRPFHSISQPGTSKQDCCLTCYDAGNCLSWMFNPTSLQCNYYTATTKSEDGAESEVCPLGVDMGSYEEMPGYPAMLGSSFGQNYGPCLGDAPLGDQKAFVRGEALQSSAGAERLVRQSSSSQQQVLDL